MRKFAVPVYEYNIPESSWLARRIDADGSDHVVIRRIRIRHRAGGDVKDRKDRPAPPSSALIAGAFYGHRDRGRACCRQS
jgi:hypothetical protein